ncbi:type II toxin-antitoxin system RelE/ParE family toxin [Nitrospinae bacterium AH_259_B05_G02_I21]|nr:type II toxin-antitoxin system RelE/ParE family toxin [Nitrospinae bacterium AH_259_B05_G02_I21]
MGEIKLYSVAFTKRADKQAGGLPQDVQTRLDKLVERLQTEPRPKMKGFRQLGKNEYRGRLGRRHRVEWMVDDEKRHVTIVAVGTKERM